MATASSTSDDLFNALGNPLRRQILRQLIAADGETSPRELADELHQPLSKLSYHVRVLAECGTLELVRTRRIRGSTQHFYRLTVAEKWALAALKATADPTGKGKP